jgi:hypothetical protein
VFAAGARYIFDAHLQPLLWTAIVGAIAVALYRRDRRMVVPVVWGVGAATGILVLSGAGDAARYSIVAVPAFVLAAGALDASDKPKWIRWLAPAVLTMVLSVQVHTSAKVRPPGASGYETAAAWIVEHTSPSTVMFSGRVDTGYFVFFMRKHDPAQRFVVLRSDKIFTTSLMDSLAREVRITSPAEIYPILQRFGTRFIVMEDLPLRPAPLVWFHDALKTRRFAERLRIPQQSRDRRLQTSSLVIYEYLDATPPDLTASLDIDIPLVDRQIDVPLADLLGHSANTPP